jgi:hypothetical protein
VQGDAAHPILQGVGEGKNNWKWGLKRTR